ncbi:hypothetical protein QZH41_008499, partial [Actinostola sp. cb2023]
LENIKSGSPIVKTPSKSEENLIEANLYKEDKSTPGKESKESYRTMLEGTERQETERTPRKSKPRTPKTQTGEIRTPDTKEKSKRRKKSRTPVKTSNEDSGKENMGYEEEEQNATETETPKPKKSPRRKGERARRRLQDGEKSPSKKKEVDDLILSVAIHRADQLKTDLQICHPMVRVHVVDIATGNYVKKSDRERNVSSYYENKNDSPVDYILPVMTQPFDFKTHKCLIPYWEEVLIFNECFSYFLSSKETDPNIIIFLEVVDFLSMTASSRQRGNSDKGWYHIAWAFLKVVGGNGSINTDKKVRLQLFYPCKATFRAKPPDHLEIFHWWNQSRRVSYPSTLYVTLKGVVPPKKLEPALRSMYAIQQEKGKVTFEELTNDAERRAYGVRDNTGSDDQAPNWTKLPGQINRIPNKQMLSLRSGKKGCFVVKFSHNGRQIPSGHCRGQLFGHFSIIYNLSWSPDDKELISSSSDGTVRTWDIHSMMTSFIKVFPHPCFVYSAEYHPISSSVIVTGGYDRLIRVWTSTCEGINGQLLRELDGHTGFINCVCFSRKECVKSWAMMKQIKEEELQGNVINSLMLHPSGLKLLVHTRNSALCMLDLRSSTVVTRYLGASNFKEHIHSALSACGGFVFSGSEDGVAYVWNAETGDLVSVYTSLTYENAVSDIDFHPMDHMIVFCSFGNSQPILVYKYDSKVAKTEAKRMLAPTTPVKGVTPVTMATDEDEQSRHLGDVTGDVMRMQRVKNKLESVMDTPGSAPRLLDTAILQTPADASHPFQTPTPYQTGQTSLGSPYTSRGVHTIPENAALRAFYQGMGTHDSASTWGSDFTPTAYPTPGQVSEFPVSPHSQQHLGASGRFRSWQLNTQSPVSPVTSPGSPMFRQTLGNILSSQHMSQLYQKPTFSFTAASTINEHPNQPRKRYLYHDNESWWMGELANGSQGYFPSNYVMEQDEMVSDNELQETSEPTVTQHRTKAKTKMTAVTSKTGELRIISGAEDSSDPELTATLGARQRRRQRKSGTPEKTLNDKRTTRKSPKKPSS